MWQTFERDCILYLFIVFIHLFIYLQRHQLQLRSEFGGSSGQVPSNLHGDGTDGEGRPEVLPTLSSWGPTDTLGIPANSP